MFQKELDEIRTDIYNKQQELEKLEQLYKNYPDLKKHVNWWKTVRYCSKSVNDKVNQYEQRHNCGCCADSPLEIWPYLETEFGRVYSDPPCFRVGEDSYYDGDRPYPNWEKDMENKNISKLIIKAVQDYFNSIKEAEIDEVDDDVD